MTKWTSDGPRQSSQPYGWSWRFLQTIMRMSHEHKRHRVEADRLVVFLNDHRDIRQEIQQAWERGNIPAENLIEVILDYIKRLEAEKANRIRALKEQA